MQSRCFLFSIILILTITSCSEDITVLSAIEDGEELSEGTKVTFTLEQNYPNPFNPSTVIHFAVSKPVVLKLSVYTIDWIRLKTLFHKEIIPGNYSYMFESENLPTGDYYYTLEGDGLTLIRKMKILK